MIDIYLKSIRGKLFPEIDDFTDPMDNMRYARWKDVTFGEYMWFNPKFFRIMTIVMPLAHSTLLLLVSIFFFLNKWMLPSAIMLLLAIFTIFGLKKAYIRITECGDMNLYDMFIRDIVPIQEEDHNIQENEHNPKTD